MGQDSGLGSFAQWLYEQAKATSDEAIDSLKAIQAVAGGMATICAEVAPEPYHDLFTEIMLYADHRMWRQTGDHNLPQVERDVEEILRRVAQ